MTEVLHMTVARCQQDQLDQIRDWFYDLETKLNDPRLDDTDLGEWLKQTFNHSVGMHWQRLLFGYETLVENACDPTKPHLAWKPEIAETLGVDP